MYNYAMAKKAFEENKALLGNPDADPQTWNLNVGLANLTGSVESDLAEIKELLNRIGHILSKQR